ncbi:outer membrane protein assembly factor BamC [Caldimonas sp. KR1-144]|uniref:outer membrane protein assembly factor BamC n=1 Tax=Caldimonas sp. KR1-144 TaxID=3400911 RepID=UPI003C1036D6
MTRSVSSFPRRPIVHAVTLTTALGLAACSSINKRLEGDKVDYKTTGAKQVSLEVPPDLSQLQRDSRYQPVQGAISASAIQAAPGVPTGVTLAPSATAVAPQQIGNVKIEREGNQRWLSTTLTPEQIWPQLQEFWQERGFVLELDSRETGLMQTNWVENRARLQQDLIRDTIGKVFDGLYDSGLRDSFRTRVERSAGGGTEIYISHRGMQEIYVNDRKDTTTWTGRPNDPDLEAIMLSRLMQKLGAKEEQVKTAAANKPAADLPARARMMPGPPGTGMQVDDSFDRAWRRVALALDRSGFTVEDRDRAQGLFYVRYVDPKSIGKGEPGWTDKLFSLFTSGEKKPQTSGPARYRIALKGEGETTAVTVQNAQGQPETGDASQRILELLVNDLK